MSHGAKESGLVQSVHSRSDSGQPEGDGLGTASGVAPGARVGEADRQHRARPERTPSQGEFAD